MAKRLTTTYRYVDVRRLARDGLLVPGNSFGWQWVDPDTGETQASIGLEIGNREVTFRYQLGSGEQARSVGQCVTLTHTPCHYGRSRPWFICPHCHQRAALLYLSQLVACRRCYDLAYKTQRESRHDREIRRINAIRKRLNWQPGFFYGHEGKPKGMHWRTYWELVVDHDARALPVARRMHEHAKQQHERIARMLAEHPEWDIPPIDEF